MSQDQELIVQVTPEGEIVGPVGRDDAHDNYILHAIVMTFIFAPADPELPVESGWMQVRSETKKQYPGFLSATSAGHITYEPDKSLAILAQENAERELMEEVPFEGVSLLLVATGMLAVPGQEQQLMFIFLGRSDEAPRAVQEAEVSGVKKLQIQEIIKLGADQKVTPFTLAALQMIGILGDTQSTITNE